MTYIKNYCFFVNYFYETFCFYSNLVYLYTENITNSLTIFFMRKTFTYVGMLVAFMFASVSAYAQATFEVKASQWQTNDWSNTPITFSYDEVAKAAGYESAAEMDSILNETPATASIFWCANADGTESNNNTQGAVGGFWCDADGYPVPYGDLSFFFTQLGVRDVETDEFTYWIGQYPNRCVPGTEYKTQIKLVNPNAPEKVVTFNFSLLVKKPIEIPTPEVAHAKLNVKSTETINVDITYREGQWIAIDLEEKLKELAIPSEDFTPLAKEVLYTYGYVDEEAEGGDCVAEELVAYTANSGFYYHHPDTENADYEVAVASTDATSIFAGSIDFISDIDTLWVWVAPQASGSVAAGEKYKAGIYFVWGSDAYKYDINVNVVAPTVLKPEDMNVVGSMDITLERAHTLGYTADYIDLNVDSIAALLGCTADQLAMYSINPDGGLDNGTTANGTYGYWMTEDGIIGSWGSTAWFAEYYASSAQLQIGHMPGVFTGTGEEKCTGKLYFRYGENVFVINVVINIPGVAVEEEVPMDQWVSVATEDVYFAIVPSASAYTDETMVTDLDINKISEILGTTAPALWGYAAPEAEGGNPVMTNAYSCDPNPGFWMNGEAYCGTWGGGNAYGMTYASGKITWYQYPGAQQAGAKFNSTFFLVNPANGKMITYNVTIEYVAEKDNTEELGAEDILVGCANVDADWINVEIDLANVATAFEVEDITLIEESAEIKTRATVSSYTSEYDDVSGWAYNADGYVVPADASEEELATIVYYITYTIENGKLILSAYTLDNIPAGQSYKTKIVVDYDSKRYAYNLTIVNPEEYTGIDSVVAGKEINGNVYDFSGRIVRKNSNLNGLAKGMYIVNGKKYIVK